MTPPFLLVCDGADVTAFHSAAELESDVEVIDVRANAYRAFDCLGYELKLEIVPIVGLLSRLLPGLYGEKVLLTSPADAVPPKEEEARTYVIRYLMSINEITAAESDTMSLEQMLQRVLARR